MSTRCFIISVPSLDPIRDAIGSQDASLVEALMNYQREELDEEYGDDPDEDEQEEIKEQLEEFEASVASMIRCTTPPVKEPGSWHFLATAIIEHLELDEFSAYSFNDGWKQYQTWEPYRVEISKQISAKANSLLLHLEKGRPFKGTAIEEDDYIYGWLTLEEVQTLHDSLKPLDPTLFVEEWMQLFHQQLLETLAGVAQREHELLLTAE